MPPTKKLSKLETLSEKVVNAVASYLNNGDMMGLRTASKTMRDHLNSNTKLQACFKEMEFPFTSWDLMDFRTFMKTPLASAVKSLKLFKTDDSDYIDQMMAFGGQTGPGMMTPGIKKRADGTVVIENPELVGKELKERPQRMFAELVNEGLPNLTSVGFVCGANLPQAQAGSLRNPKADDFEFLAGVLRRIMHSLNVDMCFEKGAFRLIWGGAQQATHMFWFEGYSDESLLHPVTKTFKELREPEDFFIVHVHDTLPVLSGHCLRSIQLHRTVLFLSDIRALTDASSSVGPLEVLIITASEIYSGREGEEHRFFTHKKSPLKTSLRKLGIVRCLAVSVPWLKVFKALRKYKQLEKIAFEKVVGSSGKSSGVVRFDWDGNGTWDDGSRLPSIQAQMDMNGTLNKMVQCCETPSSGSPEE